MRKQKSGVLKIAMAVMVLVTAFAMSAYAEEENRFVTGTSVNGIRISGLTVEEAKAKMAGYYAGEYRLELIRKDGACEYINGWEIGYQAVIPEGLQAILDNQNGAGRKMGPAAESSHQMAVAGSFDETALVSRIQNLACVSGTDIKKTEDAYIGPYQEGQAFKIVPEVYGSSIDVENLTAAVKTVLAAGGTWLKLADTDSYDKVVVTSKDEQLKALCGLMNQCRSMTITYTFGEENQEELSEKTIAAWLSGPDGEGRMEVNREMAAAYIKTLADRYDTSGTARIFGTTAGHEVELTGPYGWKLNQEAETDALIEMIRTGQSQSREPEYTQAGVSRRRPEWGNTYVEIDLTGQHVYMYQEGTLVWEAPCVTGNVSKNYTTPPGIFGLTYKETDRILRGKKLADGSYEYESHVDYWMPFNGGIGLHDASWRGSFGGTLYQTSGSHGCINLPPDKAKLLYDLVYKGIPVICYN